MTFNDCLACGLYQCRSCEHDDGEAPTCCCGRLMWPERGWVPEDPPETKDERTA